jgi:hypothetical protein
MVAVVMMVVVGMAGFQRPVGLSALGVLRRVDGLCLGRVGDY